MSDQQYNPHHFASAGFETAAGEFSPEDRKLLSLIRASLPELSSWGDLPLGVAWGSYSQDMWLLSWLVEGQHSMDRISLIPFLAYIHYHDTNPGGLSRGGIAVEDLTEYASQHKLV